MKKVIAAQRKMNSSFSCLTSSHIHIQFKEKKEKEKKKVVLPPPSDLYMTRRIARIQSCLSGSVSQQNSIVSWVGAPFFVFSDLERKSLLIHINMFIIKLHL